MIIVFASYEELWAIERREYMYNTISKKISHILNVTELIYVKSPFFARSEKGDIPLKIFLLN